ncbi:MAG: hypothetical protein ACOY45_16230 [Pseudomonadota bacterium]
MTFKKLSAIAASALLVLSGTAAQAAAVNSLSLNNVRASTAKKNANGIVPIPLLVIAGIVASVGVLEITGAIDIFDDSPDSP